MEDFSINTLKQLNDQLLTSVEGLLFVSAGAEDSSLDNLHQIRIIIGPQAVRLRCSSDGETLTVDGRDLSPRDLGEYGELRRADLSSEPMFGGLINRSLRRVLLTKSHNGHYHIGIMFDFDEKSLVICNWGDELKVWDKVPEPLFADEGILIEPVG